MSDPVRLLEEGDALEVEVLRSAAGDAVPTRVRDRVLGIAGGAAVAAGAGAASGATGAGAGVKGASVTALGVAKWVGVVVVVGAAVAGVVTYVGAGKGEQAAAPSTGAPVASVAVAPNAVVAPPENVAPSPLPVISVPTAVPAAPRSAPSPPPAARGTGLLDELGLLDGAREALEAGDVALAMKRLDRHDLEYAQGQLASDALALRVEVYAKRQDDSKVRELAQRFLAKYPEHPQAPKVRGLLERAGGTNP